MNAIVRERLESYAVEDEAKAAAMRRFFELAESVHAGSGPANRTWTRDELYDR